MNFIVLTAACTVAHWLDPLLPNFAYQLAFVLGCMWGASELRREIE